MSISRSQTFSNNQASGGAFQIFGNYGAVTIQNVPTRTDVENKAYDSFRKSPVFLVPFERDEKFINREDIFDLIDQSMKARKRAAIAGIGGVGKSQIAIEYCYVMKTKQPDINVFWVQASTKARFIQDFTTFARRYAIPGWNDPQKDVLELINDELTQVHRPWLLVLDSADDADVFFSKGSMSKKGLFQYLPRGDHISILTSTRDKRLGRKLCKDEPPINVSVLSEEDAVEMLASKLPEYENATDTIRQLVKEMEYLPLAITQAAAFINSNEIPIEKYLEIYQSSDESIVELLEDEQEDIRRDPESSGSVIRTWKLLFDQTRSRNPPAADMLCLMAFLDWHGIPESLLRSSGLTEIALVQTLGALQALSFVQKDTTGTSYQMHRLVHLAIQKWTAGEGVTQHWQDKALKTVADAFPSGKYEEWALCETYLAHALLVLQYPSKESTTLLERAQLLHNMGAYQISRGRYKEATQALLETTAIREQLLGTEHPSTLESYSEFAKLLVWRSKFFNVEKLLCRVIGSLYKKSIADPATSVVVERPKEKQPSSSDSAHSVILSPDITEDEWLQKSSSSQPPTLHEIKTILQAPDKYTFKILNQYVDVLIGLSKSQQAEAISRIMLLPCETFLGKKDLETILCMQNLSTALVTHGKTAEAEDFARQSVQRKEEILGPKHPETLYAFMNLSIILVEMKEFEEAEKLCRRAFEGLSDLNHPNQVVVLAFLSFILLLEERFADAEESAHKAVDLSAPLEPQTVQAVLTSFCLAMVSYGLGKPEAESLLRHTWEDRKAAALANQDSIFLLVGHSLGKVLLASAKNEEAEIVLREVLDEREKLLGLEIDDTLDTANQLGKALLGLERTEEAEVLCRRAYEGWLKIMGPEHMSTLDAGRNLCDVLWQEDKFAEAEEKLNILLPAYEKVVGAKNEATIYMKSLLSSTCSGLGKFSEAQELGEQVHKDYLELLGPDSHITKIAFDHLQAYNQLVDANKPTSPQDVSSKDAE